MICNHTIYERNFFPRDGTRIPSKMLHSHLLTYVTTTTSKKISTHCINETEQMHYSLFLYKHCARRNDSVSMFLWMAKMIHICICFLCIKMSKHNSVCMCNLFIFCWEIRIVFVTLNFSVDIQLNSIKNRWIWRYLI